MIVTSQSLQNFVPLEGINKDDLYNKFNQLGLEVEAFYKLKIPQKVVLGKIISKAQHKSADRLSVCMVSIGESEPLQIVCGAKNVKVDMYVALALPGAVLPSIDLDSKVEIKATSIRGVSSYGMLCSSLELGLPKLNEGIMQLDSSILDEENAELTLGLELCKLKIFNQDVYELGLTPNRGDCLYALGVAREIASAFNLALKPINEEKQENALGIGRFLQVIPNGNLDSSTLYKIINIKSFYLPFKIALTLGICKKYKADKDITNFLMYATYMSGVIFNAYPLDDKKISTDGEHVNLEIKKDSKSFECVYAQLFDNQSNLIESNLLNIIGVSKHQISYEDFPRSFILEASHVNPTKISNLIYENKDLSFDEEVTYLAQRGSNNDLSSGMNFLCNCLSCLNLMIYSGVQEVPKKEELINISLKFSQICKRIGLEIPKEEIAIILKKLNFRLLATSDEDFFIVNPPSFRNDIFLPQDVAEEVLRIYGIDNIPSIPHKIAQVQNTSNAYKAHKLESTLRSRAASLGFIECVHYLFDDKSLLEELNFKTLDSNLDLINPIISQLDTLRVCLIPNILQSFKRNKNYGLKNMRIFEVGYIYDENRRPSKKLALSVSGKKEDEKYPSPKGEEFSFYSFAQILSEVIGEFSLENILDSKDLEYFGDLINPYISAFVLKDGVKVGVISKLNPKVASKFELEEVYFAQLDLNKLINALALKQEAKIINTSKFQISRRDITISLNQEVDFSLIKQEILSKNIDILLDIYALDVFKKQDIVYLTFRLELQDRLGTLVDCKIQDCVEYIIDVLKVRFNAGFSQL